MSVVALKKATIVGLSAETQQILEGLQDLGCLHLLRLSDKGEEESGEAISISPEAREALKWLADYPLRRRQARTGFDAVAVQMAALSNKEAVKDLEDERDFLTRRIADLEPWGDFEFPVDHQQIGGVYLWFYIVPRWRMKEVAATDLVWEIVGRDNRFAYVVVLSEHEPPSGEGGMPVERTHTGDRSLTRLQERLEEVEATLEDKDAERGALSRWVTLFAAELASIDDAAGLQQAAGHALDDDPVFAMQAWVPIDRTADLEHFVDERDLVLNLTDPEPGEDPPTLMANAGPLDGGQDLVKFYTTPGYVDWDPSTMVFLSFTVFFAMILADAGYGVLFGFAVLAYWKTMGRSMSGRRLRILFASMAVATVIWGILSGGYFGVSPPEGGIADRLKVIDITDYDAMMTLSILIGIFHVGFAIARSAWHRRHDQSGLAHVGWLILILGGALLYMIPGFSMTVFGMLFAVGLFLVAGFTKPDPSPVKRLLGGLIALTNITALFSDVLSYLRLFALGLAGASLAAVFNDMGAQIADAVPGVGVLLAILVLLIGHGLNFVLSLISGFVHGLRLNFIEFFKWSLSGEGVPFRRFARRAPHDLPQG